MVKIFKLNTQIRPLRLRVVMNPPHMTARSGLGNDVPNNDTSKMVRMMEQDCEV